LLAGRAGTQPQVEQRRFRERFQGLPRG